MRDNANNVRASPRCNQRAGGGGTASSTDKELAKDPQEWYSVTDTMIEIVVIPNDPSHDNPNKEFTFNSFLDSEHNKILEMVLDKFLKQSR